jgi:hypothetical protein
VARILHPSFLDFLTDPKRCTDKDYYINSEEYHHQLAILCFECMHKALRRNICRLTDPSKPNSEVEDFEQRIGVIAPPELRYACIHWTAHVFRSSAGDASITKLVEVFTSEQFLFWLELLSLIGRLDVAIPCIKILQQYVVSFYYKSLKPYTHKSSLSARPKPSFGVLE